MYFTKLQSLQSVKLDSVCQLCKIYAGWLRCSDEISHPCLGRFKALSSLCQVDLAVLPEEVPLSHGERQHSGGLGVAATSVSAAVMARRAGGSCLCLCFSGGRLLMAAAVPRGWCEPKHCASCRMGPGACCGGCWRLRWKPASA